MNTDNTDKYIFDFIKMMKSETIILTSGYPLPASAGTGLTGMTAIVSD